VRGFGADDLSLARLYIDVLGLHHVVVELGTIPYGQLVVFDVYEAVLDGGDRLPLTRVNGAHYRLVGPFGQALVIQILAKEDGVPRAVPRLTVVALLPELDRLAGRF